MYKKSSLKKTILFGCSGFFGPAILEKYPNITAVGRSAPPKYIKNKFIKINDIRNLSKLDQFKFDRVIFLIGNSDHHILNNNNLNLALSYNFSPLTAAIDYFIKRKIKKLIIFSGALIYGTKNLRLPVSEKQEIDGLQNNYLFSKFLSEQVANFYRKKIDIINIRLSNIYGPTLQYRPDLVQSLLHKILINKIRKKVISVKNMSPARDFIYSEDAADAVVKLVFSNYSGNINLGTGKISKVKEVCKFISENTGYKIIDKKQKVSGQMNFVYNTSKLKKIIKWKPKYNLEKGIKKTIEKILIYKNELKK